MDKLVTTHTDAEALYICLNGRVDASNAGEAEKAVNEARAEAPGKKTVIDAEKLEYISSAGLRILLRLRKEDKDLSVINVSPEVYDILDMTGFTEMLTVKKAYRHLSVEGCEQIGKGANGAVYRYDPETIVKVYFNADALPDIQRERELARKALVLGINTAIPYDVVRVGESYGTVMELLEATSLTKMIRKDPEHLEEPLRYYVDMVKQIHATEVKPGEMPDMKMVALDWAAFDRDYLPKEIGDKLYAMVEAVPESHTMLHGDYHINNVMVREGEALLIDMDTLCIGHPVFELGSMYNAYVGFGEPDPSVITEFLGLPIETTKEFWKRALAMYLDTEEPGRLEEVENKAKIIGYMRLLRRTVRRRPENSEAQIAFYQEELVKLISGTDKLTF